MEPEAWQLEPLARAIRSEVASFRQKMGITGFGDDRFRGKAASFRLVVPRAAFAEAREHRVKAPFLPNGVPFLTGEESLDTGGLLISVGTPPDAGDGVPPKGNGEDNGHL